MNKWLNNYRILLIVVCLLLLLVLRSWFYYRDFSEIRSGQRAAFVTRLTTEPEIRGGRQSFTVLDKKGLRISIQSSGVLPYHYGDRLFIDGFFTVRKGRYFIYYPKIQMLNSDHEFLSGIDAYIKNNSKKLLDSSIPPVSSALLMGMVFGGRQGMPANFLEKLRNVGVIHVIAASGMNVTLVAGALVAFLGRTMRRQFVLVVSILGVVFYAFLAGFEPSIVRATVMAVIAFAASLLGRKYFALISLFFTGYVMLFFQPSNLYDAGFQLSFLSTIGILVVKPLMPWQKYFLMDDVGTTIAAQLLTLPVLLSAFGQYGLLSILVNALVLWTVPYLMIFGALAVTWGLVFMPIGKLFAWLSLPFLFYFEKIVSFFADFGWVLKINDFSWQLVVGYYFILAAIILIIKKSKYQKSKIKV